MSAWGLNAQGEHNTMSRRYLALALVLALGLVGAVVSSAQATTYGKTLTGGWQPFTGSISGGVAVATPDAATKKLTVYGAQVSCSSAGVVLVTDGTGGSTIGQFYFAANTPQTWGEEIFGAQGISLTAGNALVFSGSGTFTGTFRVLSQ